jgi:hypothetical protein
MEITLGKGFAVLEGSTIIAVETQVFQNISVVLEKENVTEHHFWE